MLPTPRWNRLKFSRRPLPRHGMLEDEYLLELAQFRLSKELDADSTWLSEQQMRAYGWMTIIGVLNIVCLTVFCKRSKNFLIHTGVPVAFGGVVGYHTMKLRQIQNTREFLKRTTTLAHWGRHRLAELEPQHPALQELQTLFPREHLTAVQTAQSTSE